ncbi:hypothetical protein GCM10023079_41640 [Streptomyces chitinivorans]
MPFPRRDRRTVAADRGSLRCGWGAATPEAPDDDGAVAPEVAWKQADHVGEQLYSNAGGGLHRFLAPRWRRPNGERKRGARGRR